MFTVTSGGFCLHCVSDFWRNLLKQLSDFDVLCQHSWTSHNKFVTASQGHLQASDIFLTFSQGLCEIFMTALICCVALAVAAGAGANAVSIPHANVTHLTRRVSMLTTTHYPISPCTSQRHCAADSKLLKPLRCPLHWGPRRGASLPEGKAIKWIIYIHTAAETHREKTLIAHCKWSLKATDCRNHLWNKGDVISSRSSGVKVLQITWKSVQNL